MKRFVWALILVVASFALLGVSLQKPAAAQGVRKYSPSCGYTIIEYGVGIDCNGDTVKIVKKNGAQVLAYQ